jgi:hypothetical protein
MNDAAERLLSVESMHIGQRVHDLAPRFVKVHASSTGKPGTTGFGLGSGIVNEAAANLAWQSTLAHFKKHRVTA